MNNSAAETAGYLNLTTPPLMGEDKGEGDNNGSNHPHLTPPLKGWSLPTLNSVGIKGRRLVGGDCGDMIDVFEELVYV